MHSHCQKATWYIIYSLNRHTASRHQPDPIYLLRSNDIHYTYIKSVYFCWFHLIRILTIWGKTCVSPNLRFQWKEEWKRGKWADSPAKNALLNLNKLVEIRLIDISMRPQQKQSNYALSLSFPFSTISNITFKWIVISIQSTGKENLWKNQFDIIENK